MPAFDPQEHIGRQTFVRDVIDIRPAEKLAAALDLEAIPGGGAVLPALWHWMFFNAVERRQNLGRDGHPKPGGFLPDTGLPRRMWAGGRLQFNAPLPFGQTAWRLSTIKDVSLKQGNSGRLCFVTLRHEITLSQPQYEAGRWQLAAPAAIIEDQDIVYREDPAPDAPKPLPPEAPQGAVISETVTPDATLLFRYSALTFNGHRIHYDQAYAREVEGYDGLVFHGPLTATLLAALAERQHPEQRLRAFTFRGLSPLLHDRAFTIHAKPGDANAVALWAANPEGRLAMQAEAVLR